MELFCILSVVVDKEPIHERNGENGIRSLDCINVNILVVIQYYSMAKYYH